VSLQEQAFRTDPTPPGLRYEPGEPTFRARSDLGEPPVIDLAGGVALAHHRDDDRIDVDDRQGRPVRPRQRKRLSECRPGRRGNVRRVEDASELAHRAVSLPGGISTSLPGPARAFDSLPLLGASMMPPRRPAGPVSKLPDTLAASVGAPVPERRVRSKCPTP